MNDKPNARELLREATMWIHAIVNVFEKEIKAAPSAFRDGNDLEIAIDAYLAAPSESAMEVVAEISKLIAIAQMLGTSDAYDTATGKAIALIEGLQRRVPRAMLEDLLDMCFDLGDEYFLKGGKEYAEQAVARILAKHGVEVF